MPEATTIVQDDSTGSYLLDGKYADLRKGLKEYKKYPDFAAAFLDIDSKRLDAVVVDEILVRYYMKKAPGKYKVLKEDLGKEVVGVGFRKDDKEFAARIDKILDEMKKDGTCKKISMQWFGTVKVHTVAALRDEIAKHQVGDQVNITILRNETQMTLAVTLQEYPRN